MVRLARIVRVNDTEGNKNAGSGCVCGGGVVAQLEARGGTSTSMGCGDVDKFWALGIEERNIRATGQCDSQAIGCDGHQRWPAAHVSPRAEQLALLLQIKANTATLSKRIAGKKKERESEIQVY